MSALAFFTETSITPQSANQGYGVDSTDKFRVSSSFTITVNTKAYAMVQSTILLQQQANDPDKVNLILRPHNPKELKLPLKYIIYRGLNITDFIDNNNLTDPSNKVKSMGSELLVKMQVIQQNRAPGEDIPLEALFGNVLAPANDKNIDEFFFKSLAASSQLFTIDCGIKLGNFAIGEIGIEVILENPEFFVDVELAKKEKFEIEISGNMSPAEKKWQRDLVRHFVDPAAFYGLHYDIKKGIEYRDGSGNKQSADTKILIYNEILKPFGSSTRNTVYLDIRNENGYSYNYYDNYIGDTGTSNDNKELKIALTSDEIENINNPNYNNAFKEYYTRDWAVHVVDVITSGSNEENEFSIALRINDNEKPLVAGWSVELSPNSVIDPPLSNDTSSRVYFTDETHLLPTPIPNPLPAFTNAITLKVPNVPSETEQLATMVKLDYIKQLRLNDNADSFPQESPTDYLFGPITTQIPWDNEDGVQWIGSSHHKYFDGWLNQGFCILTYGFTIKGINIQNNEIILNDLVSDLITIGNYSANRAIVNGLLLGFLISNKSENSSANETTITVADIIDLNNPDTHYNLGNIGLSINDNFFSLNTYKITINYGGQFLYIENFDLAQYNQYLAFPEVEIYFKLNTTPTKTKVTQISYNNSSSITSIKIDSSTPLERKNVAFIADSGMVSEIDTGATGNDNILFYAFPNYYYKKTGSMDTKFFNFKGGTSENGSLFDYLKKQNPKADIVKSSIHLPGNINRNVLSFNSSIYLNNENFLLLAIKKDEFQSLVNLTTPATPPQATDFSDYHIKVLKLIQLAPISRDLDGEIYFKYKLVVSGLDNNGDYKETPQNQGIDVFSKDGQLFSSDAYAQNVQVSGAKLMLNFRRRINYAEKGGHYGFDWMRPEYIAETDPIANRGGICIAHDPTITKQEAQDQLKQEYTPININGYDYYVPWLSMYENHSSVVAGGNPIIPTEHEVRLRLEMDQRLNSNEGSVWFHVPEGIEIILKDANSSVNDEENILPQPLEAGKINSTIAVVKCTQKSNLDRKIYVYDENNNLVGVLNILKNQKSYNLPVRLVKVNFKGKIKYNIEYELLPGVPVDIEYEFNFNNNRYKIKHLSSNDNTPDSNGYININTNKWVNFIQNEEKKIKSFFNQSLFNCNLEDSIRDIHVDFGNYDANNPPSNISNGTDRIKSSILNQTLPNFNINAIEPILNTIYSTLIQGLTEVYNEDGYNNDSEVTVFLLPIDCKDGNYFLDGFAPPPNLFGRIVALCANPNINTIAYLCTHEISHALDLLHSFVEPGEEIPEKAFMKYLTENVMDYIPPKKWVKKGSVEDDGNPNNIVIDGDPIEIKKSFWKWQWEKVHINNSDLEE